MSGGEDLAGSVPHGAVVVGVDGSEAADRAVLWAARYADLEQCPLVIAHTFGQLAPHTAGWPHFDSGATFAMVYDELQESGEAVVEAAKGRVADAHPSVQVVTVVEAGDPRQLLLRLAGTAAMLVMGSRGRGPFRSLLLGSVTSTVAGRATCPVVVIPPGTTGDAVP